MRSPDMNRVKKAQEHLKAAKTLISNIKWENVTELEYDFIVKAKDKVEDSEGHLQDIITIQEWGK